jgi:thioester reductase-like protein
MRDGWRQKVLPIGGDLELKGLGLTDEHKDILLNEVNFVINSAASVNFDDPILESLNINYFGALRMFDIIEQSKSIIAMAHVSTAYVNSNRPGFIEEKIYPLRNGLEPEDYISQILKLNPEQCAERKKDIIGDYPNTYTFTKSCAERVLMKRIANGCPKNVAIIRPSIVCGTEKNPMMGWTETLSAG